MNDTNFVFQVDSEIVREVYNTQTNYLIEYNEQGNKECCAVYFCSNDIYYPNTADIFRKRIIEKNFFEWYKCRIHTAYKNIFIRDVFKQWYLCGISRNINTPEKLLELLQKETAGYKNVIMVGSSAGGYAAILYGSLLGIQKVIAFNPQFEIKSLLKESTEKINPLVFRLQRKGEMKYFDIVPFINKSVDIYYFFSNASPWDIAQNSYAKGIRYIHRLEFKSRHHGIPFLKVALPKIINLDDQTLKRMEKQSHYPISFTIKMVGIRNTIHGLVIQIYQTYKKRH